MTRVARLAAAALAVALPPRLARAEGPPPQSIQVYCVPGSLNNCYAFAITDTDGHITFWFQNLQGSLASDGAEFDLTSIGVSTIPNVDAMPESYLGPGVTYIPGIGTAGCNGMSFEGAVLGGINCFEEDSKVANMFHSRIFFAVGHGVIGCTSPPPEAIIFVAKTCLPEGLNGWVRFDGDAFRYDASGNRVGPATLDEVRVGIGCAGCVLTDINYADIAGQFTTVPEPASVVLLASGLLGTGVVGTTLRGRQRRA